MRLLKDIAIFVFLFAACQSYGSKTSFIKDGKLDLSDWDFNKNKIVELIESSNKTWNPSFYDKKEDTAVFDLIIILPEKSNQVYQKENLALKIPPLLSTYYLWLNENIVLSNNLNYNNLWKGEYQRKSQIVSFFSDIKQMHLLLKITQFSRIKLIRDPILFGTDEQIRQLRWWKMFQEGIITGVFLNIFIINFFLWLSNRKHYSFLILGLFSFFQTINLFGRGETLDFLSQISDSSYFKWQLIILFCKLLFLNAFLLSQFYEKINKYIFGILSVIIITLSLICLFLPWLILGSFLIIYYIFLFITLVFYLYRAFFYFKMEKDKAFVSVVGIPFLLLSFLIDAMHYKFNIFSISLISYGDGSIISYGFMLFVITYTYYLYINNKTQVSLDIPIDKFVLKYNLSGRESDVIKLLIKRYSYKEISESLFVSVKTIDTHIYHIYQKTGVNNKNELFKLIESFNR